MTNYGIKTSGKSEVGSTPLRTKSGFSLIELVIVVVIIGVIAAIAIPRMSRGAAGAADSALRADLSVLRSAIDLYTAEHVGALPTGTGITKQLLQYSDAIGNTQLTKSKTHIYGPYLRSVPPLPVGVQKGKSGIGSGSGAAIGWVYDSATGNIHANCTAREADDAGVLYSSY